MRPQGINNVSENKVKRTLQSNIQSNLNFFYRKGNLSVLMHACLCCSRPQGKVCGSGYRAVHADLFEDLRLRKEEEISHRRR